MTDHTPEPWADYRNTLPATLSATDYARARACVNACAGIPTEQLEAGRMAELIAAARLAPQYIFLAELDAKNQGHADLERDAHKDYQRLFAALAPFQDKSGV